jgi:hypothetical protein
MHEYDIKRSFHALLEFIRHPGGVCRKFEHEPDILGALLVLDIVSFLTVLLAVFSGYLPFSLTWGFVIKFVVLYLMILVVFVMLTGFEAGVAALGAALMGRQVQYSSLFSIVGYSKLPLIFSALLYIFLPERLSLDAVILMGNDTSPLQAAFAERLEIFELMAFGLAVVGLKVLSGLRVVSSLGIMLVGWLISTPIFYCVTTSIF